MNQTPSLLKHIWLADDDEDDRTFFQDALKEINVATELSFSNDGVELMNVLNHTVEAPPPPHVIFLDLNMPRKNGFECLKEIRSKPKLKAIPIVIFSTTANDADITKSYHYGANFYLCKPRTFPHLKMALEKVLKDDLWKYQTQTPRENFFVTV